MRWSRLIAFWTALALAACSGRSSVVDQTSVPGAETAASADAGTSGGDGGGSIFDGGSFDGGFSPTDGGEATDAGAPDAGLLVRFVAMGDTGEGSALQTKVGNTIDAFCATHGCDFVLLLGDNIYSSGVSSTTDPQWQTKFEQPYANVNLPFWASLGNHDYGGDGAGWEPAKAQHQVDYTAVSTKWKMPAHHYRFTHKHVEFFAVDSNAQLFGLDSQQRSDVRGWLNGSTATWKIVFGHHPYKSNGPHGNAGTYNGLPPFTPIAAGQGVKSFVESVTCGRADFYLSGHDHSRQWLATPCQGTELIVSGAGAKASTLEGSNPTHFQKATVGFLYVRVEGKTLTAQFVDENGAVELTRSVTKP
ncbi:MAG: metallophosphoesterase [Myxococcota bacterium]